MKIYKLLVTTIIIAGMLVTKTYAQKKNWAQDADNAYKSYQYYDAVGLYKKAFSKVKKNKAEKARIIFQVAECYRITNDTKQAETWYKKAIAANYSDPIAKLYYGDMLKVNEKYDEGLIQYNAYKAAVPSDVRGANGAESCTLAQGWKDNPTRYEVENMKQFNTKDMDFAATYYDKKFKQILFTSSRDGSVGKDLDLWTGQNFSDLWLTAQDKKGVWSSPVSIGENINTKYNEGAACLNPKFNDLYFTRCTYEKKKQLGCQIYVSKKKGTAWDIPEPLVLGPDSFSYGHPSLTSDELTLYFSSDMPGTLGGKDLWTVHRTKKTKPWDKPVNLGQKVNTENDDMYPFIRDDGSLYFASNGLIGMGGLDIYKLEKVGDHWSAPINMKSPINSAGDDFAIVFEGKLEKGYLSSNRKGGKGSDDIYSFYKPPLIFTLAGSICNDSSKTTPKELIKGAVVTLFGSDGTIIADTTGKDGLYSFSKTQFLPSTSYEIKVEAKGYFGAKGKETTVGLERSKDFIHDFCLVPIPKEPIVLPEILYGFNEWVLQPQYQDSLNGLIKTMEDNENLVIELGSHTDTRGTDLYNDTLSYKRAKSVVDYLISKGIAGDRLVPFGYGEKVPRVLTKDITMTSYVRGDQIIKLEKPITFTKGTTLNDDYINQFSGDEKKFEAAHQLNRRTTFRILREDYVPRIDTSDKTAPIINIKSDSTQDENNLIIPIKVVTPQPFKIYENIDMAIVSENNIFGIQNKDIEKSLAYKQN